MSKNSSMTRVISNFSPVSLAMTSFVIAFMLAPSNRGALVTRQMITDCEQSLFSISFYAGEIQ